MVGCRVLIGWSSPTLPGYDTNQVGLGIDRNTNPYLTAEERKYNTPISEKREEEIRLRTIRGLESSYNNRMNYAKKVVPDFNGVLSPYKEELVYEMLYKNPRSTAQWWTKDTAKKFIEANDDDAHEMAKQMHKKYFTKTYNGRNEALDKARERRNKK